MQGPTIPRRIRLHLRTNAGNGGESSRRSSASDESLREQLRHPERLNTVKKLHLREIGGFPRLARAKAIGTPEKFRNFQLQEEFNTYDPGLHWFFKVQFFKNRAKIIEFVPANDVIFVLSQTGLCVAFSRTTNKRICYLNMSGGEVIKNIFYNKRKEALIALSVYASDEFTALKCRSTPLESIRKNQLADGRPILESESLKWPGFVEFDDMNGKLVAYIAADRTYKVYDLKDYSFLYSISDNKIVEIKISLGIMLLVYKRTRNNVPMTLRSIEDGKVLKSFNYLSHDKRNIEVIEQFNEKLLIKKDNNQLQILDLRNFNILEVNNGYFTPSAYIFLYESRIFLTFPNGRVQVWSFQGDHIASFQDRLFWHPDNHTNNVYITSEQDMIISYCKAEDRREEEGEAPAGSVRMSNILTGKCIAEMSPRDPSIQIAPRKRGDPNRSTIVSTIKEALHNVTAVYYDEDKNEIFTGNEMGLLHIWSN